MARLVAPRNLAGDEPGASSERSVTDHVPDGLIVCDVSAVDRPDLATIDSMARLCLATRRAHAPMAVLGASPGLRELIAFVGLASVFYPRRRAAAVPSAVEVER